MRDGSQASVKLLVVVQVQCLQASKLVQARQHVIKAHREPPQRETEPGAGVALRFYAVPQVELNVDGPDAGLPPRERVFAHVQNLPQPGAWRCGVVYLWHTHTVEEDCLLQEDVDVIVFPQLHVGGDKSV